MNCRKIYQALSAYMDGELPGVDALVVRQHLAGCHECRAEYEALRHTKQLLSRLRMKAPRPDLPQDIVRRLQMENRRATKISVDAIWEQFAERLRSVSPTARSLAFGASLAVFGFGFVAMQGVAAIQSEGADDIQWNVASANRSPLAPAPSLMGTADSLSAVSFNDTASFSSAMAQPIGSPSAFTASDSLNSPASDGLSGPILVPGGRLRMPSQ